MRESALGWQFDQGGCAPRVPSVGRFLAPLLQAIMVILTLLATLVGGFRSSLVASHTHCRLDIPLVVSTLSHLLVLCVRLIASLAASCVTLRPALSAASADAVLLAKRPNHGSGIFISLFHRTEDMIANRPDRSA